MSFCGTIIRDIYWLERQTQILVSKVCRVEALEKCSDWQDEGYNQCIETRDEGYNQCSRQEDQGYNDCCDWFPCSWACDAWVWVSHIVCVAWTWISNIVCVVWDWISKWVCRVINWVYTTICRLIVSIVFWFVRRVLTWIVTIPCKFGDPDLDPRIRHIFVLVLENRSFDHMFGETPIRGTDAESGAATEIRRRAAGVSNDVRDATGHVLHTCAVGPGQKRAVGDDPGHEFGNTLLALCGLGKHGESPTYPPYPPINNSGFAQSFADKVPTAPCSVMLSYTERDVPVITALAREFAVCDNWFSSMPGPTWPNRYFFHAASSAGLDDSPSGFDSTLSELVSGLVLDNGTIYDMLDSENIDWAVYHGDAFPQVMSLSGMDLGAIATNFHDMDDFEEDLKDGSIANFVFIEPDYGDDITGNTFKCGNSQHPLDDVTHGERLIKRVYEAIRGSELWGQSLLIVTYDEGGGFFDHARPGGTVPPGDSVTDPVNNHNGFDFSQLGVRVPAIVCSPWIPRNVIDHRPYEHASVPATVESLWNLPNMTDRDKHVENLSNLLTLSSPRLDAPATLPPAAAPEASCPDDGPDLSTTDGPTPRPKGATIFDSTTLARARQRDSNAILSTTAAFMLVALRRDLQLAPRSERRRIYEQVRRFQTMGEAALYGSAVRNEVRRQQIGRGVRVNTPGIRNFVKKRRARTHSRATSGGDHVDHLPE
jgi:phospholipase C